jgi:hypothetical protein
MLLSNQRDENVLEKLPASSEATIRANEMGESPTPSISADPASPFIDDSGRFVAGGDESIRKAFDQTFVIPRVSLREATEEGDGPIQRPNSSQLHPLKANSRYQLQGEIARGGMGAIIKGRDKDLGRDLAIKVLLDTHRDHPDVIERFIEEAQIGGQLHPPWHRAGLRTRTVR